MPPDQNWIRTRSEFVGLQGCHRAVKALPPLQPGQFNDADSTGKNAAALLDQLRCRIQRATGGQKIIT